MIKRIRDEWEEKDDGGEEAAESTGNKKSGTKNWKQEILDKRENQLDQMTAPNTLLYFSLSLSFSLRSDVELEDGPEISHEVDPRVTWLLLRPLIN